MREAPPVPTAPARPRQLRGKVFRGADVFARGWLTRKQLRSAAWRRLRQDVYADAALPVTHRLMVSAVGLALPDGAGFAGRSAIVLWGATDLADMDHPVEVALPPGRRWNAGPGVHVRSLLPGQELLQRGRWRCTSREDTAVDLLRCTPLDDGVVLLDRLCRSVSSTSRRCAERRTRCPGVPGAHGHERRFVWPTVWPSHRRRPGCVSC
jgi:hypothetical protein